MITKAYVVPHPPIILPEVGRGEEKKISSSSNAYERVSKEISQIKPDTIIICSSHAPFLRDAFYAAEAERAYGDLSLFGINSVHENIEYDQELLANLKITCQEMDVPLLASSQAAEDIDHGSLIPIRFIHKHYQNFKVLRIGMSMLDAKMHYRFGQAIAAAVKRSKKNCVFIASGDLSHVLKKNGPYGYSKEGPEFDNLIVKIFASGNLKKLFEFDQNLVDGAKECGLRTFHILAGAISEYDFESEFYSYDDTFGVGYAVAAFTPDITSKVESDGSKSDDPPVYIRLAKASVESYVKRGEIIPEPHNLPKELTQRRAGAFVTLYKNGNLRGCIGTIEATRNDLAEEIIYNAVAASTQDPRFPAVNEEELDQLVYSVDILGEKEEVTDLDELDPKQYGVIVSSGWRRGLLLPRLEGVDSVKEQIFIALHKAGIDPQENYKIERFEVVRYEE